MPPPAVSQLVPELRHVSVDYFVPRPGNIEKYGTSWVDIMRLRVQSNNGRKTQPGTMLNDDIAL